MREICGTTGDGHRPTTFSEEVASLKKPLEAVEEHFGKVRDPRIDRPKDDKLIDIIAISLCGVICGAEGWVDIEVGTLIMKVNQ